LSNWNVKKARPKDAVINPHYSDERHEYHDDGTGEDVDTTPTPTVPSKAGV
jgi:hypothetical protein